MKARFWKSDLALMPVERQMMPHAQESGKAARRACACAVVRVVCLRGVALGWRGLCRQAVIGSRMYAHGRPI